MAKESNPALRSIISKGVKAPRGGMRTEAEVNAITKKDVVNKTFVLLFVVLLAAVPSYLAAATGIVGLGFASAAAIITALTGLGVIIFATFTNRMNSPLIGMIYSVLEGVFLGFGSFIITMGAAGEMAGGQMIALAVMSTLVVFGIMLFLYRSGFITVNKTFIVVVTALTLGVLIVSLGALALNLLGFGAVLRGATTLGILFSLFCIVLAALNLCIDFHLVDELVEAQAGKEYAWGAALGLVITLVWLYIEILILIRNLTSR